MKILMLTDRLDVGGAETHIAELALGLKRAGVEVEILSAGGATADRLAREGIVQHHLNFCTRDPIRLLFLRRQLRTFLRRNRYDVVHAHARIPALLLRGNKMEHCARIVTVHAHFSVSPLLRRLCYWGERTVAVSEDLRSYVCDTYRVPAEAVRVIPNGIDCEKFTPRKKKTTDTLRVLFASRLDADCSLGAELLCRIAPTLCRRNPQMQISIAGGGSEFARIRALADGVNRVLGRVCITLYGQVEDMPALLREQDIFVGVSRVAMEAAACGCAVILCGNEGYLGILSKKNTEEACHSNFCCRGASPANALRLECDLRLLTERKEARRLLGMQARALILSEFSAQAMVAQTLELYRRASHPPARRRILVGGYFGCGNAGDDAILQGFLEELHRTSPEVEVCALTADPNRSEARFGIRCIERKNFVAIRAAMKHADMFVCGGGSLLQNATSRRSLCYYLSLLRMAKRAGCLTVLYAAGIGPICGERAEKRIVRVLSSCDYISLRDPDSMRFLTELGVDRALLHEGADPALLMPLPPPTRTAALRLEADIPLDTHLFCVILRRTPRNASHLWRAVVTAVQIFCRRHGLEPLFLRFCEEDGEETAAACRAMGAHAVTVREAGDLAALLRDSRAILSMRLHALILAAATATPAIGLSIDPNDKKIAAFARLAGQESIATLRPSVGELVALAERQFRSADAQKNNLLASAVEELQKKARKDLANIVEMLYNKREIR